MTVAGDAARRAQPVTIEHSGRSVDAIEWSSVTSGPTIVVAVEGELADVVGPVAELLMERNRVVAVNIRSAWDAITISWSVQEPIVLLAQGKAGDIACESAQLAPGAVRALVLADVPLRSSDNSDVHVPVLVFHGRESSTETHAEAVSVHGQISGSHLIELDGCAELPTKNCPVALAESLTWYLDNLGQPVIEFSDFAGAESEPLDPKA